MADAPANKPLIPSITGNPFLDTAIRIGLTSASAAITAVILTWLNAHGFHDPNLGLEVGGAVLATMIGAATVIWSFLQTKMNQLAVVQHVITTAATGEIPDNIKAAAVKAPSISDVEITKAINNAEATKASQ